MVARWLRSSDSNTSTAPTLARTCSGFVAAEHDARQVGVAEGIRKGEVRRRHTPGRAELGEPSRDLPAAPRDGAVVHAGPPRLVGVVEVLAGQRPAGEDVGGDEADRPAIERGADRGIAGLAVFGEAAAHLRGDGSRCARRVADVEGRRQRLARPHPGTPCSGPTRCEQPCNLLDHGGDWERRGRDDGVDEVDVVEPHAPQRSVQLAGGVLVRPVLPPQLVGNRDVIPTPSARTEQLAEDDLGPARVDREPSRSRRRSGRRRGSRCRPPWQRG